MKLINIEDWNRYDKIDRILLYLESGLDIRPIREFSGDPKFDKENLKHQKHSNKHWEYYLGHPDRIITLFCNNPDLNVGVRMPEHLLCVDVDDTDAFYALNGGEDYDTLKSTSGRGVHYWFLQNGTMRSFNGVREGLDYKTNTGFAVLPPSLHHSGKEYRWVNLVQPIEAPRFIYELYETRMAYRMQKNPGLRDFLATIRAHEKIIPHRGARREPPIFDKSIKLEKGCRHDALFQYGRKIKRTMTFQQLDEEMHSVNKQCCTPPLDTTRMESLLKQIKFGTNRPDYRRTK